MEAQLALPAYEQVLKAAHTFNLLDARGAISVTERAALHRAHSRHRQGRGAELPRVARAAGLPDARRRREGAVMSAPLLVELFTEELPPKALKALGERIRRRASSTGSPKRELARDGASFRWFATPRRLAVLVADVKDASEPRAIEVKLMPVSVGLDAAGKVTPALAKKLAAIGRADADPATFKKRMDGKSEMLFLDGRTPSVPLEQALQASIEEAIAALPIPKVMSYQLADGRTTVQFVRPAHGLVALHGGDIVAVHALGLDAGRVTHGHRFQGERDIPLANAKEYEEQLRARRQGDRRLRGAQGRDPPPARRRGGEGGSHAGRGGGDLRAAGRGDGAGGNADGLRRRLRGRVPRGARRVPRAHDAPEPEVFPAVRRRRQAHQPLPHREQHESGGSVEHRAAATSAWSARALPTRASSSRPTRR